MPYCCSEKDLSVIFFVSLGNSCFGGFCFSGTFQKGFCFHKMVNYVFVYCLLDQKYYPNYLLLPFLFLFLFFIIIMLLVWLFANER